MELPKNVTQIGESEPHCKIYVEDYTVSFLKELNKNAMDKDVAAAVYGYMQKEGDISYIFIYGAGRLDSLQREVRHLSQAQLQEMERIRKKYFPDYELMGYWLLNGEMPEGMYIYEQGICRYTGGYAQFYEKNESMLAYMLDFKGGSVEPEVVDWKKYNNVRRQPEAHSDSDGISENERKELNGVWNENRHAAHGFIGRMKFTAAVVFALLCIIGVANINDGINTADLKNALNSVIAGAAEEKRDDVTEVSASSVIAATNVESKTADNSTDAGRLVAQDKLADAVLNENAVEQQETTESEIAQEEDKQEEDKQEEGGQEEDKQESASTENVATATEVSATDNVQSTVQTGQQSYTIKKGDTLLEISIRQYGDAARIKEICSLNNIDDPDDIKVGQKIFLP